MSESLDPDYPKKDSSKKVVQKKEEEKFATEIVDLPSKGLVYPEDNPLKEGSVELKYMTAREEDILTSQNLIQKGVVIDKLLQSLIISHIDYNDLIIGDKNAIMIAARVLGYGKDYQVEVVCPHCGEKDKITVDLTTLQDKELDDVLYNRENEYEFTLPNTKHVITYKLLTHADEKKINEEIRRMKALYKKTNQKEPVSHEFTIRLKHIIIAVDGKRDTKEVRRFVDNLLSVDSFEFRKHLRDVTPDINMTFDFDCSECGGTTVLAVPMTVEFFWPDSTI